jgi:hypothetical protein
LISSLTPKLASDYLPNKLVINLGQRDVLLSESLAWDKHVCHCGIGHVELRKKYHVTITASILKHSGVNIELRYCYERINSFSFFFIYNFFNSNPNYFLIDKVPDH